MEIELLIKRYSDSLTNLCFTANRVIHELYDSSKTVLYNDDYVKNGLVFLDFILVEIEHARKSIIYLQNLNNKEGV